MKIGFVLTEDMYINNLYTLYKIIDINKSKYFLSIHSFDILSLLETKFIPPEFWA